MDNNITKMKAVRHRRRSDDPFFREGDRLALKDSTALVYYYVAPDTSDEGCYDMYNNGIEYYDEKNRVCLPLSSFPCSVFGCNAVFDSTLQCEAHFEEIHMFECSVCQAVLPNDYLLDLHLQESHDFYFSSAVEKNKASFKCLSSTCSSSFLSDAARTVHIRSIHGYPKWFRFHLRGIDRWDVMSQKQNMRSDWKLEQKHQKWLKKKHSRTTISRNDTGGNGKKEQTCVVQLPNSFETNTYLLEKQCCCSTGCIPDLVSTFDGSSMHVHSSARDNNASNLRDEKQKRREKQKSTRAAIPCKFHNMNGRCWRGEKCMFLHSDHLESTCSSILAANDSFDANAQVGGYSKQCATETKGEDVDMVDELADCILQKARVSVPDSIAFGRRRRERIIK